MQDISWTLHKMEELNVAMATGADKVVTVDRCTTIIIRIIQTISP